MFSSKFYEISKSTFFTKHLWTTASEYLYFTESTNDFYQLDFLKVCFKLLYEKSLDWIRS